MNLNLESKLYYNKEILIENFAEPRAEELENLAKILRENNTVNLNLEVEYYMSKGGVELPAPVSNMVSPIVKHFLEGNGRTLNLAIECYSREPVSWEKTGEYTIKMVIERSKESLNIRLDGNVGSREIKYNREINIKDLGDDLYSVILNDFIVPYFGMHGEVEHLLLYSTRHKSKRKLTKKILMIQAVL